MRKAQSIYCNSLFRKQEAKKMEKQMAEINMERARYLLSTDEMLEEVLNKSQG
jgi:hypothetical protein